MKTLEIKFGDFEKLRIKEEGFYMGFRIIRIGQYRFLCNVEEKGTKETYKIIMLYEKNKLDFQNEEMGNITSII